MNIRLGTLLGFFSLLLTMSMPGQAQENSWPRTLPVKDGSVTVYPLQVESMTDDLVRFRAALAYRESDGSEPVFGVGWFVSKVEIDRTNDVVHPVNLVVSDTRFPAGTDDVKQELTAVFARQSQEWNLDFPLTELVSSLETAEQETKSVQNLNTAPPTIIYKDHPALLVNFDGEPVLRKIENSEYQAVINTAYPLIYDGNAYYLGAADGVWYSSDHATGQYRFETRTPAEIVTMVDAARETETKSEPVEKVTAANAPEIVVATTPTELIVTEGPAAFVPLVDDLLVLSNTGDDVFMHISTQQYYVVLAGRWYHSASLNGPWAYSASDELPPAFASIPEQSDQAGSRVYVAGTEEAREAVLDAQIPQTAAVERGAVDLDVTYDGDPQFEPVAGTEDLAYANNTGSTVLQSDRQYYLVEDGVWYVSSFPNGPWEVSAYRPAQVATISPQSPVYNVKYVYIYDSTPEVVYVGYTPGYIGSYVYHSTIVYGTGWYYQPWVSPYYYYPRYNTWGFNVSYNPWYGWGFGLSWGWGPFYAGWYSGGYWHHGHSWYNRHYSHWGPRGYRPRPVHHGRYAYGHDGYDRGGYDRGGNDRGGYNRNQNLYRNGAQRAKVADVRDYGRGGEKLNRAAYKDAGPAKNGRGNQGLVTNSELRVKAQARDSKYNARKGNSLVDNTVSSKGKAQSLPARNKGSWEKVSATNEVRRAKKVSPVSAQKPVARDAGRTEATKQQPGSRPIQRQKSSESASLQKPVSQASARQQKASPGKTPQAGTKQRNTVPGNTPAASTRQQAASPGKAAEVTTRQRSAPTGKAPQGSTSPRREAKGSTPPRQEAKISASPRQEAKISASPRQQTKGSAYQGSAGKQSAPQPRNSQKSAPTAPVKQQGAPQKSGGRERGGQGSSKRNRD
jgi:hypothetical protein